ncbi:DUF2513 domain-containing protein [Jeotgalibacillus malaysiensis]|uniref:DUF2513 domain-containing protein n=1 Tax=Jeotgalibacillus malaysiensis TaxID=1508404 RepID=UPI00384BA417
MERNVELLKKILLYIELDQQPDKLKYNITIDNYDSKVISYHIKLLVEAGFLEGKDLGFDIYLWGAKSLTNSGHDFLDAIRNDTIWNKTQDEIKRQGMNLKNIPLDMVKALMIQVGKQMFGL